MLEKIDDDGKLRKKYNNKKTHSKNTVGFNLTLKEYCQLVIDAGLVSSQIGFSGDKYVLGRYGDTGSYEIGNCKFITQSENNKERKTTEKMSNAWISIAKHMTEQNKNNPEFGKKVSEGIKRNGGFYGEKNSQYKTFWITNGGDSMKWKKNMEIFLKVIEEEEFVKSSDSFILIKSKTI